MSNGADASEQRSLEETHSRTTTMASTLNNNGFRQAMLKTALETIPQLTEENYSIWKDKMTALLELRGVLASLDKEDEPALASDINAELKLLLISKMDSVTHNNIVTADNRGSAKLLWKAIKDCFASSQSSNRARIFNKFLYVKFKEEAIEAFVTDTKVSIKKLVDVGIDLPQDILAYLILFKFPDSLQLLKHQIMHSNKELTVEFVCNHLTQFNNKNKAEVKDAVPSNQAALVSTKPKRSNRSNGNEKNSSNSSNATSNNSGPKRCTDGFHNPKQDGNHSADSCWHLHPEKAPEWWQEAQAKWKAEKNVNYYMSLITLWIENGDPNSKIILDSGASAHIFNDKRFFDKLELKDCVASEPASKMRPSQSRERETAGALVEKGCNLSANSGSFSVSKENQKLFKGKIVNNLFSVDNPESVGQSVDYSAHFTSSSESLKDIHEKFGHASIQRIKEFIPDSISKSEL
ncbi:uncharacterized protein PGTG_01143 [Puccinia graminis f. sp. tritici CRL 75-36-700-3]|uniref:GAG-pre-integrase domain-containing protein n=1 Tax=Puccinia graminis f. sp. tritici (strain CRL 75-36-700-3 / race SCCL) TaxID=418459 RepID=E3JUT7_PUCGT|nr:uncharacterized protein PGTG_01143 [Puccinia graminis f. sp. tritici CRL 75-36-700-3]EFP75812.1 hypothetical protein PGTG_01143 [Puccinia graminis f. sp. tritici CRL 75-36-700-3]